jgi:hypothetical protein
MYELFYHTLRIFGTSSSSSTQTYAKAAASLWKTKKNLKAVLPQLRLSTP